jgi:hypothetical protein
VLSREAVCRAIDIQGDVREAALVDVGVWWERVLAWVR